MTEIQVKRVYDDPAGGPSEDGFRVYADALWPQGESHATFRYDLWAKDVAPSAELRRWFHEDRQGRWDEFADRYRTELKVNKAVPGLVRVLKEHKLVTLLYSSRDATHNNVDVLAEYLRPLLD